MKAKDLQALLNILSDDNAPAAAPTLPETDHGLCIVVLDRGFVYIGHTSDDGRYVRIRNAHCIRRWGTTAGLGQLAREGKQSDTKLDAAGDVLAPFSELKHLIRCEAGKWKSL